MEISPNPPKDLKNLEKSDRIEQERKAIEKKYNEVDRLAFHALVSIVIVSLVPLFWSLFKTSSPLSETMYKEILMIGASLSIAIIAYFVCYQLIPAVAEMTKKNHLWGNDVNKIERPVIPESLGVVPGTVYVVSVCVLQLFMVSIFSTSSTSLSSRNLMRMFFENNAGLFTSCFMLFLGFADDVLDLRWRYKLILPSLAVIPLIIAYQGSSSVILPGFFKKIPFLKQFLDFLKIEELEWIPATTTLCLNLGHHYKIYMGLLAVFCSNSINILAGINGLETSQAVVIGISCAIHNIIEIQKPQLSAFDLEDKRQHHFFSLVCMLPFVGTSLALLEWNWFPSSVFVGDTFTYFSGMTLATCGILGHYSKTLILFFLPQIVNFLISIPQLFGIVSCPRHRLPVVNKDPKTGKTILSTSYNWNLINVVLLICGPMTERSLSILMVLIQILSCCFGFFVRYFVFDAVFKPDLIPVPKPKL